MFEEEAKKYAENTRTQKEILVLNTVHDWGIESLTLEERHLWEGIRDRQVAKEQGFKDGAEFGYNKASEDFAKQLKEVVETCNHWQEVAEKANEWHYVKSEEDLPKDNSEYLLLLEHGIRVFGYYNGKWWESWKGDLSWQEVKAYFFVPVPKLPKESE